MYQLLETICCINGKLRNIELHQSRVDRSSGAYGFATVNLKELLAPLVKQMGTVKSKVRVLYGPMEPIIHSEPYTLRPTATLKCVEANSIEYGYKFAQRKELDRLFAQRGSCDNILIIKNGLVTDTAYTNIIGFDGVQWITPRTPLLKGTMREYLLNKGALVEDDITVETLEVFEEIRLINAMLSFEDRVVVKSIIRE